jgi:hypothetical protein
MTAAFPDLADFPGITAAQADGVPVLLAPRAGNTAGGIIFRVGSAHETLATSGITHLIEHLALRDQVLSDAHLNGHTHADVTVFHVAGSMSDVVAYLNDVCAALRDLPVDLIETEKDILRSEAEGRSTGFAGRMRINRHGARGFGLAGYGERGLDRITADEVLGWSATRFTQENALAWISADALPEGLDLRLPTGRRRPAPVLTNVLPDTPVYLAGLRDGVAFDTVVPRGYAAQIASGVLREVLHRDLRGNADIASTLDVGYEILDDDLARVSVTVQAADDRPDGAVGGLADALGGLRFHVAPDDLAAARAEALDEIAAVASAPPADLLPALAHRLISGSPLVGPAQARAKIEQVTADDVRAVASEMWSGALWFGPGVMDWAGIAPAPVWSQERGRGRTFRRKDAPDVALVLAAEGVSLVTPDGAVTVRFDDCVLLECVPDGARVLTGADGFRIVIEPTLYEALGVWDVVQHVDPRVSGSVTVRLPARDPGDIPVAEPPPPTATGARGRWSLRGGDRSGGPVSVMATVMLVAALWVAGIVVLGGGQLLLSELLDFELRLGLLPVLALVWASVSLVRQRHGKSDR